MSYGELATEAVVGPRLDTLERGVCGVLGVPDRLDPMVLRLQELGMTPGAEITLTRRAPWGDPIEVSVRGTRLCVRRADASRFPVRLNGG